MRDVSRRKGPVKPSRGRRRFTRAGPGLSVASQKGRSGATAPGRAPHRLPAFDAHKPAGRSWRAPAGPGERSRAAAANPELEAPHEWQPRKACLPLRVASEGDYPDPLSEG